MHADSRRTKKICRGLVAIFALICLNAAAQLGAQSFATAGPSPSPRDIALLREVAHLQRELGRQVWQDWVAMDQPLVYRTHTYEYFIGWNTAPAGAVRRDVSAMSQSVWVRGTRDTNSVQAARTIEGRYAVLISAPDSSYDPALWALKACHELFHLYQRADRVINPFVGAYATYNELTFPFKYSDPVVNAALRIEGDLTFRLASKIRDTIRDPLVVGVRLFKPIETVDSAVLNDSLQLRYKQWMEWSEGVARYTEREMAKLARDIRYHPSGEFLNQFPNASYQGVWEKSYAAALNPIRFVGGGVNGGVMFYYLGMGKAYVLDQLDASWKAKYHGATLDDLLFRAATAGR